MRKRTTSDPERVPEGHHPIPWDEVSAQVPRTAFVVGACTGMPPGWTASGGDHHSAVVVVDPTDELVGEAVRRAGSRPLVVVAPNVSRPSYVRALLVGTGDTLLPGHGRTTRAGLDRLLGSLGRSPRPDGEITRARTTGRPLDDFLAGVSAAAGGHDRPWLVRTYDVAANSTESLRRDGAQPFLSVLVRTQGTRPQALADALLCLAAQTDEDIEVLLLTHDVGGSDRQRLEEQVHALPSRLSSRTRVVPVVGGGRSRPLSVGTREAGGSYFAVLDDDDLVLGHWVETFRRAASAAPGQLLRSLAVEQDVEVVGTPATHRAGSWPRSRWDRNFSLLSHVVDNHSPIHSYAYPREVFHELGLGFDESLPVLEDWDLLVRAATLLGVHDTDEVTAVYRRWPATRSSFAEIAETDWPETAWRVVEGWDRAPLLLPAGSATRLRREGIETSRRKPLRDRVNHRLEVWRDVWSPRLMRTRIGPPMRWCYRGARRAWRAW